MTDGPTRRACARARGTQGSGVKFSAEAWRDRCDGREGRELPYPAVLVGVGFDPPRPAIRARPEPERQQGQQICPHAPSLERHLPADCRCNALLLGTMRADSPVPSQSRAASGVNAERPARPSPPDPYRHSRKRRLSRRVRRPSHDAQPQGPPQRRAKPRGRGCWSATVPSCRMLPKLIVLCHSRPHRTRTHASFGLGSRTKSRVLKVHLSDRRRGT